MALRLYVGKTVYDTCLWSKFSIKLAQTTYLSLFLPFLSEFYTEKQQCLMTSMRFKNIKSPVYIKIMLCSFTPFGVP